MPNWKKRNWKTAAKQPVKNVDLWQQLDEQVGKHQIEWQWVRGHMGHPGNERADQLANRVERARGWGGGTLHGGSMSGRAGMARNPGHPPVESRNFRILPDLGLRRVLRSGSIRRVGACSAPFSSASNTYGSTS